MDNKQVKAERVKKIFAETARQMIIDDGYESATVRNVAEKAAYAYPTLYNHFHSLDELFLYTRDMMIMEVGEYIRDNVKSLPIDADAVAALFRAYIDYYLKYPNIFRFFYFFHIKKNKDFRTGNEFDFETQISGITGFFIEQKGFDPQKTKTIFKTILYSVHGMLMLHLCDNYNLTKEELYKSLDEMTHLLFDKEH